ncbi:hypothetical protein A2U01_0030275, partial [Trifolium medium]|nr:hypothetical protein [Trifolium medium]
PRSMVPPAPDVDLYKPKKRKRAEKTSEGEEPKKKEVKKEAVTTSEKKKEDTAGKEKVVEEKAVVGEEVKKKDLKRKSSGIKFDEGRSKMKHDKASKEEDSSTESDEVPLAQKLKQKTSEAYAKEMHKKFSKGKSSKSNKFVSSEAHVPGFDIPLNTVLPENQPINVSSSTSPDTAELDREVDAIINEGVTKFGEIPNPDLIAQHLFEVKQMPDLTFLETHLSPNPLAEQTFTHDQDQQEQEQQNQPQPQPQPQSQPEIEPQQPEQNQTQPE